MTRTVVDERKHDTIPAPASCASALGIRSTAFNLANDLDEIEVAVFELENEGLTSDGTPMAAFVQSRLDRIKHACEMIRIVRTGLLVDANGEEGQYAEIDAAREPASRTVRCARRTEEP
jgi:hypothetical protein